MLYMLYLSQILLSRHDLESFEDLVHAVRAAAGGERFLRLDIKPPFPDTPENWEDRLEGAFSGVVPGRD